MNFEDFEIYPKLNLSDYFHPAFLLFPLLGGLYLIISSLHYNLILNDELGFIKLFLILKGKPVEKSGDYLYGYNIYNKVRSPFRAGLMLLFFSFSSKWDLGRCLFTSFFCLAMYIEGDQKVIFEPSEAFVKAIATVAPRKVFKD